jgi:hypothetical protein
MELDTAHLTPLARRLRGEELVREMSRQELASVRAERSSGVPRLSDAIRFGKAVGLAIAEMERMAGCSRQTIYNLLPKDAPGGDSEASAPSDEPVDLAQVSLEVLGMAVAAEGSVPLVEVSKRLHRPLVDVITASRSLHPAGLVSLSVPPSKSEGLGSAMITATPEGEAILRSRFDDLYLRRSEGFAVYIGINPKESAKLARALPIVVSGHDTVIIEASVAPSTMSGPELAMSVNAPTSRMAVAIARDVWDELRIAAGLAPAHAHVVDVAPPSPPPSAESAVLDEFAAGIGERGSDEAVTATLRARARYGGGSDERALAGRCLTAAAWGLRLALGQDSRPRPISDADAAWGEWCIAHNLRLDRALEQIQKPLLEALELATDRLGPFRGGEIASLKAPGHAPSVVESVTPTPEELERMARLSGQAFGAASKLVRALDVPAELRAVFG